MAITKSTCVSITCLSSIFSLIIITSAAAAASVPHNNGFQILDVSASLQQALQVFSPNQQQLHSINSSAHYLSITLHSRSSLPFNNHHHHHHDYASLTLSRLARDEARVNSLSTHSRCICNSRPEQLETPVTSGIDQGSGEYFARIGVGRPTREQYMVLDTGSDVTWLQCQPCTVCYRQSDPIYDPANSSTYRPLPCKSRRCAALEDSTCLMGRCNYEVFYGDGSSTTGNFATETISLGLSSSIPDVAIGCGHDNEGLYSGAAGLLGLGRGSLSLPSQIRATSFSYCLVNRDSNSSSTLDFNSTTPADSVLAPLINNPFINTYYYVGLTGINVGGHSVQFPSSQLELGNNGRGGVIIDSGTTVTRLPMLVYNAVRDEFRTMSQNLTFAGGFSLLDTCYNLSSLSRVRVPTVSLQFSGGTTLALPPRNYMLPVNGRGIFCFAFAGTWVQPSIIGNVQQQGMRVSYDLANKNIGFSPNRC